MNVKKATLFEAVSLILIVIINRLTINVPQTILLSCGSSSILNAIYIGIIAILFTYIITKLFKNFANSDIVDVSEFLGGKFLKYLIGVILYIYIIVIASLIIRDFVEIIHIIYYADANIIYLLAFFAISSIITSLIGSRAVFRTNLIFCTIMIISLLIAFCSVIPNIVIERIFPILGYGTNSTFFAGISNIIAFNGLVVLYVLPPFLSSHKDFKKASMIAVIIGAILLVLATSSMLLAFSFSTNIEKLSPLYTLLSNNEFGRYFQHPESLFIFTWILSFISYLNICCILLVSILKKLSNVSNEKPFVIPSCMSIIILSLLPKNIVQLREICSYIVNFISVPLVFFIFPFILILANIKHKRLSHNRKYEIAKRSDTDSKNTSV